jgi:hypothetical protein
LSDTARIALPVRARWSIKATPASTSSDSTVMTGSRGAMETGPQCHSCWIV